MYLNNLQLSQHDKRGLCGAGRSQPALEKGGGGFDPIITKINYGNPISAIWIGKLNII